MEVGGWGAMGASTWLDTIEPICGFILKPKGAASYISKMTVEEGRISSKHIAGERPATKALGIYMHASFDEELPRRKIESRFIRIGYDGREHRL